MASETEITVIGRSAVLRGDVSGECDVQIDGTLEGSVHVTAARITVGPEAKVRALLSGRDIVVHGHVEGELRAIGRVELRSTAVVIGDVFAARFAMEADAVLRGHVDGADAAMKPVSSSSRDSGAPSSARPLPLPGAAAPTTRPLDNVTTPPRPLGGIPSGLAAAAATVATAQRPAAGAEAQLVQQPSWAAEPKNS